jgi:hypothetical protein
MDRAQLRLSSTTRIRKVAETQLKLGGAGVIADRLLTGMLDFALMEEGKRYVPVVIIIFMAAQNRGAFGLRHSSTVARSSALSW